MQCPQCKSTNVSPVPFRGFERMVRFISPKKPFRCNECLKRFLVSESQTKSRKGFLILLLLLALIPLIWLNFFKEPEEIKPEPARKIAKKTVSQKPPAKPTTAPPSTQPPAVKESLVPSETSQGKESSMPDKPVPTETSQKADAAGEKSLLKAELPKEPSVKKTDMQPAGTGSSNQEAPSSRGEKKAARSAIHEETLSMDSTPSSAVPDTGKAKEETSTVQPAEPSESATEKKTGETKPSDIETIPKEKPSHRTIKGIKAQPSRDEFKVIVSADGPIQKVVHAFANEPPRRFIINLPGNWKYSGSSIINIENDMVERVRIGTRSNLLSIVVDLTSHFPISQSVVQSKDGLVVSLKKSAY